MNAAQTCTEVRAQGLNLRVVQVRPARMPERLPEDGPDLQSAFRPDQRPGEQPGDLAGVGQDLRKGRVVGRLDQSWKVALLEGGSQVWARRAAGCLLRPRAEDTVLLLVDRAGSEHYLLNVLERESDDRALDFPGDVYIEAEKGGLRMRGETLDMEGASQARLSSRELTLTAACGRMRFIRLDLLAESLHAGVRRIKAAGERIQILAAHMVSRVGRVIRSTGFELHRAERLRTEVEKSSVLKAGRASILARDDVTVDADKINIG